MEQENKKVISLVVPGTPPSTNHLYGNRAFGRRVIRYMTTKGKNYKELIKSMIPECDKILKPGLISCHIFLYFGDKRKHDLDNAGLKIILDAMEDIVYEDDNQINWLLVEKEYDKENPRTEVTIVNNKIITSREDDSDSINKIKKKEEENNDEKMKRNEAEKSQLDDLIIKDYIGIKRKKNTK